MHVLLFHSDYHNHDWNTFWLKLSSFARPAERKKGQVSSSSKAKNFRRRPGSSNFKCRQLPPTLCRQRLVSPKCSSFSRLFANSSHRGWSTRCLHDFWHFFCNLSARHGLNGNQSKRAQAGDEVTNDTRMPVNPIQKTAPSMASTLALPSIQPQNWAMNAMNSTGGIPLDFLNTNNAALEDEDDEEIDTLSKNRKNRQNRKNKGRKNNKKSGKKNKKLKYGTLPVVVSPGIYSFVLIFLCLTVFERCEFLKLFAPHF